MGVKLVGKGWVRVKLMAWRVSELNTNQSRSLIRPEMSTRLLIGKPPWIIVRSGLGRMGGWSHEFQPVVANKNACVDCCMGFSIGQLWANNSISLSSCWYLKFTFLQTQSWAMESTDVNVHLIFQISRVSGPGIKKIWNLFLTAGETCIRIQINMYRIWSGKQLESRNHAPERIYFMI